MALGCSDFTLRYCRSIGLAWAMGLLDIEGGRYYKSSALWLMLPQIIYLQAFLTLQNFLSVDW